MGIEFGVERMSGLDTFYRWKIPFLTKGAFNMNQYAGHIDVLGIHYHYNSCVKGWATKRSLNFWNIVTIFHEDTEKETLKAVHPGFRVKWCRIIPSLTFKKSGSY